MFNTLSPHSIWQTHRHIHTHTCAHMHTDTYTHMCTQTNPVDMYNLKTGDQTKWLSLKAFSESRKGPKSKMPLHTHTHRHTHTHAHTLRGSQQMVMGGEILSWFGHATSGLPSVVYQATANSGLQKCTNEDVVLPPPPLSSPRTTGS